MKSRGKRILTALMVAGALAGLLAIVFLPGRWDRGAEAHVTAGVEVVDTGALCTSHILDGDAVDDCTDAAGVPTNTGGNGDAIPSNYLVDTDGDTTADAISVAAGTTVTVVAHGHTGTADSPDGTDVTFTASGSAAVFQAVGLDADADGMLGDGLTPEGETGALAAISDTQLVIAQVVNDVDNSNAGDACGVAADTCIDDADDADLDGTPAGADDGIAIVQVRSGLPTSSTITATTALGSDTTTIIWTGAVTGLSLSTTLDDATDPNKTVTQTIIAQEGTASAEAGVNGDPDLTLTATATDSAGNPVQGVDIDCTLDTAGGARADIIATSAGNQETTNVGVADPGGNSALDQTTTVTGQVQATIESENEVGDSAGDVTITCWADSVTEDDLLGLTEASATATIRVSGPPAAVDLQGSTSMTLGTQTLKAVITDADGEAVANDSACTWLLIDPLLIAALTLASPVASDGNSNENTLVAGAEGTITVSVTCGTANALISVTVSGALPTATTVPATPAATVTPGGPTVTPVPPVETATPVPPVETATPVPPVATQTPLPLCAVGDVNGDTLVDAVDASLILQFNAGLIDALPGDGLCP